MPEEKISIDRLKFATRESSVSDKFRILVCPTTGGQIEIRISGKETIQGLKLILARKLKIAPEKISLLYKNTSLRNGTLSDNDIRDASQITLLPNMESGMTFQRPDASVIQALENLSETQINDFLTGRAPLLLAMRVGDHMMFVQLQLSTSQCVGRRSRQTIKSMTAQPTTTGHSLFPSASSLSPASLAEASRNLSQKLQELSRVPKDSDKNKVPESRETSKTHSSPCTSTPPSSSPTPSPPTLPSSPLTPPSSCPSSPPTSHPHPHPPVQSSPAPASSSPANSSPANLAANGAVINSMNHLGRGVFSGTFSGTLDPTLQDQNGKPKKDVSTIVHILTDLLGVNAYQLVHPYVQIRAPPVRRHEAHTTSSPVINGSHAIKRTDDEALKEKVQHLQRMMQERKLKRKARRELKGPYQWSREEIVTAPVSTYNTQVNIETESASCSSADSNAPMDIAADNIDSSTYRNNSNLEQESLAV